MKKKLSNGERIDRIEQVEIYLGYLREEMSAKEVCDLVHGKEVEIPKNAYYHHAADMVKILLAELDYPDVIWDGTNYYIEAKCYLPNDYK